MSALTKNQFRGRYELKLDPKGRLSLPSAYRTVAASAARDFVASAAPAELIITNSRFRGRSCLHVYTANEWQKLEGKMARLSALRSEVQAFSRFYLSAGQAVELDGQGRVLIPQSLRRFAGLDAHVMLVGMADKFEIWSQAEWEGLYSELTETFEETMDAVASSIALMDQPASPSRGAQDPGESEDEDLP